MILKKLSGILLITTLFSSFPAFATTIDTTSNATTKTIDSKESKHKIADWDYTIYDKNGKEKSSGKLLSNDSHKLGFSKTDISLDNGDSVRFHPDSSNEGFYCTEGTTMSFSYNLSESASIDLSIHGYSNNHGYYSNEIDNESHFYDEYTAPHTDHYYVMMTNVSSDLVTIDSFYLYF